jgi:hypothetical protein
MGESVGRGRCSLSVMINRNRVASDGEGRRQPSGRPDRKHALIVAAVLIVGSGAGIWGLTWSLARYASAVSEAGTTDVEVRTGTILDARTGTILEGAKGRCRYFDNDTGRTSTMEGDCEAMAREKEGSALRGTQGRINAIKKSFAGNK